MKTKSNAWTKHLDFLLLDLVSIEIAFFLAYFYRHHEVFWHAEINLYNTVALLLPVVDICYALLMNAHHNIIKRGAFIEFQNVLVNNLVLWGFMIAYIYMTKDSSDFSRMVFSLGIVFSSGIMYVCRLVLKQIVRYHLTKSDQLPNLLIVTTAKRAPELISAVVFRKYNGFRLVGLALVGADSDQSPIPEHLALDKEVPIVRHRPELESFLIDHVVDDIMISLPESYSDRESLIRSLVHAGPRVHIPVSFQYSDLPNRSVENLGGYLVITSSMSHAGGIRLFLKRLIDIAGCMVGLPLCGLALLIVGPMIKKASPGPIFFSQWRVGKNGRRFKMYKFRSMVPDAEAHKKELAEKNDIPDGMMFKMKNDPRIIGSEKGPGKGIGNFIRKTSIDELPQFWNVLKNDMSLVGTRPPTVDEVEKYQLHHKGRLSMKPGITGMWQVSGRSDITDFESVVKLDEEYISNWSLGMDIKILVKTVLVVFKHKGAE